MKSEIGEIKVKHRDILKKHLDEIKQIQFLITQTFLALRKIEKSTDIFPTIEYSSKIREFQKRPPKVQVSPPKFIPKPIAQEKLYSLFGQITCLSTAIVESVLLQNRSNTSNKELLDEPKLVATIQNGYESLRSVSCLDEDKIWMSGLTKEIKCFYIKGVLLQTIEQTSGKFPIDIALDSDGDLLYINVATQTIIKVKKGQTKVFIKLQGWMPLNLCVTSIGGLLVTMCSADESLSKVVRYSGSKKIQTIQYDKEGKSLYSGNAVIKYITENRNHDICVADCSAAAVVVVNQDGGFRWRYAGNPSAIKNKPFDPKGITTDSQRHILTADFDNHCIHILDQNGQFLRYIDNCDLKNPWGLCTDNNDNLYVCDFFKSIVKQTKYLG